MSQLTHMRQHIKAIQTIKKITHAMRLISMSLHSRIKQLEQPLNIYQQTTQRLFTQARLATQAHPHAADATNQPQDNRLIILIGSQKGLNGSFNANLFHFFNENSKNFSHYTIITVGKRATQYVQKNSLGSLIAFYNSFGLHNALTIAHNILQEIIQTKQNYNSIIIYSNSAQSFFIQKPTLQQIIPIAEQTTQGITPIAYEFEQPLPDIVSFLTNQYLLSQLQHALFQSLLAEHAARFISMDSSTRNAENLLEQLLINYNKLRQAKITRELTELSSFFLH